MKFKVSQKLFEQYPDLIEAVVVLKEIDNTVNGAEVLKLLRAEEEATQRSLAKTKLSEHPQIKPWRDAFQAFGSKPSKYSSSVEALLKRVLQGQKLPDINPLVNLYNYCSIKHILPFGGEDFAGVYGDMELKHCNGDEEYFAIFSDTNEPPDKGEVAWVDAKGVTCRKWNWRQCDRTKITPETKEGYFIIDGLSAVSNQQSANKSTMPKAESRQLNAQIKNAANEFIQLAEKYLRAKGEIHWITKDNQEAEIDVETKNLKVKTEKLKVNNKGDEQRAVSGEVKAQGPTPKTVKKRTDKEKTLGLEDTSLPQYAIRNIVWNAVQKAGFAEGLKENDIYIEHPQNEVHGDYSTNIAMKLAGQLKKNPKEIAEKIAGVIVLDGMVGEVSVIGGFINITLGAKFLALTVDQVMSKGDAYGSSTIANKQKLVVEYSSPNIAKPFTVGHLRSTIIGDAIANNLEMLGYEVYRDNHTGDWGTQFGKQIYAIKTWGNMEEIEKSEKPVKMLVDLYVKFHEEAEKNPEIEEEGRKWFKKLEDGDPEARQLWEKCINWSWKEFDRIYRLMKVSFTENDGRGFGESYFEEKMPAVIDELREKGLLKESKGAQMVFFENDKLPPAMIIKKDGATLYATRDLATDKHRLKLHGNDIIVINEVGAEQTLYFKQLFEMEHMLGWYKPGQRFHVAHGLIRFKEGKMSTRKGNVIWLEEVLDQSISKVKKIMQQNDRDYSDTELEEMTTAIGIGALKWNDLKRQYHLNVVFDWDEILNTEGNSGPYVQYTYARAESILREAKLEARSPKLKADFDFNEEELVLLRTLYKFPEVVLAAGNTLAPNIVCNYVFDLAQKFNLFYKKHKVLQAANSEEREARLAITAATAQVLKNGLNLLGIEVLERM